MRRRTRSERSAHRRFLLASVPALLPLPLAAQIDRLSGPLPSPSSDVVDFALDSGGTRAVYLADQDQAGVRELYSVRVDLSSAPVRLNDPLPAFADVAITFDERNFLISPTGRIVYRADAFVDETFELFSVPIDGSAPPVHLNPAPTPGGDVVFFTLSPDGTHVVYIADQDTAERFELYSVPIDGSAPPLALHPGFTSEDAVKAWVSPDGSVLHSVVHPPVAGQGTFELYSVPINASLAPALLDSRFFEENYGGYVEVPFVAFSPDGQYAAFYLHSGNIFSDALGSFLVRLDGSGSPQVIGGEPFFTSAGDRVVYTAGTEYPQVTEHKLFNTTLAGVVTPLDDLEEHAPMARPGADGSTVFFLNFPGVYRVPADGGSAPLLLSPISGARPLELALSPDGSRVVYSVRDEQSHYELRSVSSTGGASTLLGTQSALHIRVSPDSKQVLYGAGSPQQLFLVPIDGSFPPRRVNAPLPPGGGVWYGPSSSKVFDAFAGDWVVYLATQNAAGVLELFRAPLEPEKRAQSRSGSPRGPVTVSLP